jgi:glutamyl-tRNA reductase
MMDLVVAGLSHHTAPLALRERLALPPAEVPRALDRLVHGEGFPEGLILSTCNRTEVYARPGGTDAGPRVRAFLEHLRPEIAPELASHVYLREGEEAVQHLFRVAAGLDSLILGEPEIVRQMSEAYGLACSAGTAGPVLHRVVPRALQVGKRVRTDTGLSRGIASVAGAAVGLAGRVFRDVSTCSVLAIGAGETVATALSALRPQTDGRLVVVNRTLSRAEELAARFGGTAAPLADAARLAGESDIVVAATASPEPHILARELGPHVARRGARPLLILDLGVPRDVEPVVGELPNVYLHSVDDLHAIAARGRAERAAEVPKAEAIVAMALSDFKRRRRDLDAAPAIKALLDGMLEVRESALTGEKGLTESERAAAERVSGKLVDKLLRRLAPRLKDGSVEPRELLDAFGIEPPEDEG